LVVFALAATASTALAANVRPDARFGVFPADPVADRSVRFVSYACDPDGRLVEQAWDLDGDGVFDDAFGRSASRVFPPGDAVVRLRVTDDEGATAARRRDLMVGPPIEYFVPPPFRPPLLSPFPIVRLAGSVTNGFVRIRVLSVRAPICSRITVRCRGRTCPFRRQTKVARRKGVRFPALRRTLAAGTVLQVFVRKRDRIGKHTRFRIRINRPPLRRDRCLEPGRSRPVRCPDD
jgi:hypothetical protein